MDPGYRAPGGWTAAFLALIALCWVVALVVLPRRRTRRLRPSARSVPRPGVVGFVSLYLTMAFLTTLLPLGLGSHLLLGDLMSPLQRLFVAAMTAVPFGLLVLRWRAAADWSDRHRIWLIGGILVSHTAFMVYGSVSAVCVGAVTLAVEVYLLTVLTRYVRRRPTGHRDGRHAGRPGADSS
ncbi:hypothetical protein [Streptomyces sp. NPDC006415]|uniref:hypothetical protein n=1 Tax=Streptomyces sp. NPDC006415 TaxID=3155351 RepID=UPI0033BCE894